VEPAWTLRTANVFSTVLVWITHATHRSVLRRPSFCSPGMTSLTRLFTSLVEASVPNRREHSTKLFTFVASV